MKYRFLSPALEELAEATEYYEKASAGLGLEFLDEVEAAIRRIMLNPKAWTRISANHRRCRLRRFPFALAYSIETDGIVLSAIMDLRRNPKTWQTRLGNA